jgi:hypothetical protein
VIPAKQLGIALVFGICICHPFHLYQQDYPILGYGPGQLDRAMELYLSYRYRQVIIVDNRTISNILWQPKGYSLVHHLALEPYYHGDAHWCWEKLIVYVTSIDKLWGHHHCCGPISSITCGSPTTMPGIRDIMCGMGFATSRGWSGHCIGDPRVCGQ